jgi:hypothetical protein
MGKEICNGIVEITFIITDIPKKNSQDSSVGIATGYWLNGRCLFPGMATIFLSTASKPAPRPSQPPIQWVAGTNSLGFKQPGT